MAEKAYALNPFERKLSHRYGAAAAKTAAEILERMALPLPDQDEFTKDSSSLHIYLKPYGLAMRFGLKARTNVSALILEPFVRYPLSEKADFEILPGVRKAGTIGDLASLKLKLLAEGIAFPSRRMTVGNIGHIMDEQRDKWLPIVTSRWSCRNMFNRPATQGETGGHHYLHGGKPTIQDQFYQDYYTAADLAFGQNPEEMNSEFLFILLQMAWDSAALPDDTTGKKLFNHWAECDDGTSTADTIISSSSNYAMRL